MINNSLKIINEKFEKYSDRLQQNKMPEIRSLWDEAFIFRALPHIFRAKSTQPLQQMTRTRLCSSGGIFDSWGEFLPPKVPG